MIELRGKQWDLFDTLSERENEDVPIVHLYLRVYNDGAVIDHRCQQQRVGRIISHVNRKLAKHKIDMRIVPGALKRTYKLAPL